MIDPIGSNPAAITTHSAALAAEHSAQQPAAAVRVTRSDDSHASGSSTSQSKSRTPEAPSSPPEPQSTLEKALELVNSNLQAWSTGMRFDVDEDAQRVVISIIDSSTGEVLRTVPSDAVLRVAKMIVQLQGTTVNTQA